MSTDPAAVSVADLTRRLADTPKEFTDDATVLTAVAGDVLLRAAGTVDPRWLPRLDEYAGNRKAVALLACWVVADDRLLAASPDPVRGIKRLLAETVPALHEVVRAKALTADPDRREELARLALRDLQVRPEGENEAEAVDRLSTVDSVRRAEVLRAAREAEARAAAVRKAMEEQRAKEAAARYTQV
jgi:hypothetical protein